MKKIDKLFISAQTKIRNFLTAEEGDTNFVSMLLIIGIVVVLAGLFLTLGRGIMDTIIAKVQEFLGSLG